MTTPHFESAEADKAFQENEDRLLQEVMREQEQTSTAAFLPPLPQQQQQTPAPALPPQSQSQSSSSPPDYTWLHNLARNCYRRVTPYVESIFERNGIFTGDDLKKLTREDLLYKLEFPIQWTIPIMSFIFRLNYGRHHWDDQIDFEKRRPPSPPKPQPPSKPIVPNTEAQNRDTTTAPVFHERHGAASHSIPAPRLFKRSVPNDFSFDRSVEAVMELREFQAGMPPGREEDLQDLIPTDEARDKLIAFVKEHFPTIRSRPQVEELVQKCGLTDDDVRVLFLFESSRQAEEFRLKNFEKKQKNEEEVFIFPLTTWMSGWLMSIRRDDLVKRTIGPFFTRIYRAMEKLPKTKMAAFRGVKVDQNGADALRNTFDSYQEVWSKDKFMGFWAFTKLWKLDSVPKPQKFDDDVEELVYVCKDVDVVDLNPFKFLLERCDESEVTPLCPLEVQIDEFKKEGNKVIAFTRQCDHDDFSYVDPIHDLE